MRKSLHKSILAAFAGALLFLCMGTAGATVWIVDKTADTNDGETVVDCSLREAIAAAGPGDLILFSALFDSPQRITLNSGLVITKNITIGGPGADKLSITINNPHWDHIFEVSSVNGTVTLDGMTLFGADYSGVWNESSDLFITNCFITLNRGGGVQNLFGGLWLINSTVALNYADHAGLCAGGVGNGGYGYVLLENSTVSSNIAVGDYVTGGVGSDDGCVTEIHNCTIANNLAIGNNFSQCIGGVYQEPTRNAVYPSDMRVRSTIVAGNFAVTAAGYTASLYTDVYGSQITSEGFNLVGIDDTAGAFVYYGDQRGTIASSLDARLDPLDYYGGPTPTQRLQAGSTAIDGGNSFGLTTDQRGYTRPVDMGSIANPFGGDGSDIGAYEAQYTFTIVTGLAYDPMHRPLAGALIMIRYPNGEVRRTVTDNQGRFRFEGVRAYLTYTLGAQYQGLRFDTQTVIVPEQGIRGLVFQAKR